MAKKDSGAAAAKTPAPATPATAAAPAMPAGERLRTVTVAKGHTIQAGRQFHGPEATVRVPAASVPSLVARGVIVDPDAE